MFIHMMLSLAVLFVMATPHGALAQKKVGELCLTSSNKVVVRSTCASSETKLSLSELSKRAPAGNKGATGAQGAMGRQVVSAVHDNVFLGNSGEVFFQPCPAGKTTVGGGCYPLSREVNVYQSFPVDGEINNWLCGIAPITGVTSTTVIRVITYAICVDK